MSIAFMAWELCYFEFRVLVVKIDPTSTTPISTGLHFRPGTPELKLLHSPSPITFSIWVLINQQKKFCALGIGQKLDFLK